MHIVVCVKPVVDPELPQQFFSINPETNRPDVDSSDMVMDSYAENALETAIQLRDKQDGAKVTAICLGDEESENVLRSALAFTADDAIRVWDPDWEGLDGQQIGHIISQAIRTIGGADIILTGYQASDIEEGLVGPVIAEELQTPCLTLVSEIDVVGEKIVATCVRKHGQVIIETSSPSVHTIVSSERNVPRLPKVKDIRLSRTRRIKEVNAKEIIGLKDHLSIPTIRLEKVFSKNEQIDCEMIQGEDGIQKAIELADRLDKLKAL